MENNGTTTESGAGKEPSANPEPSITTNTESASSHEQPLIRSILGFLTGFSFHPQKTAIRYFSKRSNMRTFGPIVAYAMFFSLLTHLSEPLASVTLTLVAKDILVIFLISAVGTIVYFFTARLAGGFGNFKDTIMAVAAGTIPLCAYSFVSFAFHFLEIYTFPMMINYLDLVAGAYFVFISIAATVFALKEAHDFRHSFQYVGMLAVSFVNIMIFNYIYSLSYLYFLGS